ncbi:MAG: YdaU family protein [Hyphomicrobiaceae bacterium]|nr:YdaU family protein [Hyphomicrobiaceae bacterium]
MSNRPWYKRYGGDFVQGTLELTLEQKGAYSLVLDLIYDRGGAIPDNERWLAGVCGVSLRKWRTLKQALIDLGKIYVCGDKISNLRADIELEKSVKMSQKLAENGAKGGRKRAENNIKTNKNNGLDQAGLKPTCATQKPESRIPPMSPTKIHQAGVPASRGDDEEIIDLEFEKFWRAFPPGRKQDKIKARRKYRQIVSGRDPSLKASVAELQAGVEQYAGKRVLQPERFTKMPCTWLVNGCWLDEDAGAPAFKPTDRLPAEQGDPGLDKMMRRILGEQKYEAMLAGGSR